MFFERIKSEGLAHNSYLVGSRGQAFVVDPRRDCQVYLDVAEREGLKTTLILETHRNEDYVIGSVELGSLTGAPIYHGPGLPWKYGNTLKDGQRFQVGDLAITAVHTPGHTFESMTYGVADTASGPATVLAFTGDALFVDEVGRVDLMGEARTEELARALYGSIRDRILPLGEGAILCPAHGKGSVCGGNISDREQSSIGIERAQNPALQLSLEKFVARKKSEILKSPPYFKKMEVYNLEGPPKLGGWPRPPDLSLKEFQDRMSAGAVILDTRFPADFCGAHIPGSYSILLSILPDFAGWVLPYDKPLLLVVEEPEKVEMAVRYLVRMGYDNIAGALHNGIEGWYDAGLPTQSARSLFVQQLKEKLDSREPLTVLDVRAPHEWQSGHIEGSINVYVGLLEGSLDRVPRDKPVAVVCTVGRRASLGTSILQRAGFMNVHNVLGSMMAWKSAGFPVVK